MYFDVEVVFVHKCTSVKQSIPFRHDKKNLQETFAQSSSVDCFGKHGFETKLDIDWENEKF